MKNLTQESLKIITEPEKTPAVTNNIALLDVEEFDVDLIEFDVLQQVKKVLAGGGEKLKTSKSDAKIVKKNTLLVIEQQAATNPVQALESYLKLFESGFKFTDKDYLKMVGLCEKITQSGKAAEALKFLDAAIAHTTESAALNHARDWVKLSFNAAHKDAKAVTFLDLAQVYLAQNNDEQALANLNKASEIAPFEAVPNRDAIKNYSQRAQLYIKHNRFEEALADSNKIIELKEKKGVAQISDYQQRVALNVVLGNYFDAFSDVLLAQQSGIDATNKSVDQVVSQAAEIWNLILKQYEEAGVALLKQVGVEVAQEANPGVGKAVVFSLAVALGLGIGVGLRANQANRARANVFRDEEVAKDKIIHLAKWSLRNAQNLNLDVLSFEQKEALLQLSSENAEKLFKIIAHSNCQSQIEAPNEQGAAVVEITFESLGEVVKKEFDLPILLQDRNLSKKDLRAKYLEEIAQKTQQQVNNFAGDLLADVAPGPQKDVLQEIVASCLDSICRQKIIHEVSQNGASLKLNDIYQCLLQDGSFAEAINQEKFLQGVEIFNQEAGRYLTAIHADLCEQKNQAVPKPNINPAPASLSQVATQGVPENNRV